MADAGKLLILGVIQGLTEFFPVSSSGHLVIFFRLFRLQGNYLAWTAAFHGGTFVSITIFFWKDLQKILFSVLPPKKSKKGREKEYSKLFYLILLGSLPAVIVGMIFFGRVEYLFQNIYLVAAALALNGGWLIFSEKIAAKRKVKLDLKDLGWLKAVIIGIAQVLAIVPGISRSGATIGCGYLCGLKKELAFHFAFLLALPVTFGAVILSLGKVSCPVMILGGLIFATALVGLAALKFLSQIVKKGKLSYFAYYCWAVSFWVIMALR